MDLLSQDVRSGHKVQAPGKVIHLSNRPGEEGGPLLQKIDHCRNPTKHPGEAPNENSM